MGITCVCRLGTGHVSIKLNFNPLHSEYEAISSALPREFENKSVKQSEHEESLHEIFFAMICNRKLEGTGLLMDAVNGKDS